MRCEIIAVGTELLMGQITNTNAREVSRELTALGVGVYYQTVVGDNAKRLEEVFRQALQRTDLIVLCGGLGPTDDDLTRETVAGVLGLPLEKNREWERKLEGFFQKRKRPMSDNNRRQALVPRGGELLPNDRGTAPGIFIAHKEPEEQRENIVVLLPGPPNELVPMFQAQVIPRLKDKLQASENLGVLHSKILRIAGMGESAVVSEIAGILERQTNPTIAPLAKKSEIHLRITALAPSPEEAMRLIEPTAAEIKAILGESVYGEDDEELETAVAKLLRENHKTVALAESCSGGFLSHRLTNVPHSSLYFKTGLVTYSNRAKTDILGVDPLLMEKHGAVSAEVATEMARCARKVGNAHLGIGITGIAGPTGGTPEKPVGLTYIALATEDNTNCNRYEFWGSREDIKERASQTALLLLRNYLLQ